MSEILYARGLEILPVTEPSPASMDFFISEGDSGTIGILGFTTGIADGTQVDVVITDRYEHSIYASGTVWGDYFSFDSIALAGLIGNEVHVQVSAAGVMGQVDMVLSGGQTEQSLSVSSASVNEEDYSVDIEGISTGLAQGTVVTIKIRDEQQHEVTATVALDANGRFSLLDLNIDALDEGQLRVGVMAQGSGALIDVTDAAQMNLVRNHAPDGTDATLTASEDVAYAITGADLGFLDDDNHGLTGVRITSLPSLGSLRLNGVSVLVGQVISRADLDAGNLRFQAAQDSHGQAYAGLQFTVQDSGATHNEDLTPNTLTFNVMAVNDAPVVAKPMPCLLYTSDAADE